MGDYLRVQAEGGDGRCVLRVTGDLDMATVSDFADLAEAAVQAAAGRVVVDLSGLTFIDVRGAFALAALVRAMPAARRPVVRGCPPHVRLVLSTLDLPLNYLPADYLPVFIQTAPQSATRDLVERVQHARLQASEAKLRARWVLARLADTGIKLASTQERGGLILEQGKQARSRARATRDQVKLSRQGATT